MCGSRTAPIDFDSDLAIRRPGIATARRTRACFDLIEEEATDLALRAPVSARLA